MSHHVRSRAFNIQSRPTPGGMFVSVSDSATTRLPGCGIPAGDGHRVRVPALARRLQLLASRALRDEAVSIGPQPPLPRARCRMVVNAQKE
jgi:hypothetical protein